MNEYFHIALAIAAGWILGIIFFGGLWFTIQKAVHSKIPALWFIVSFIMRTGITLGGFYLSAGGNWQRLLFCLGGFILARIMIIRRTKSWHSNLKASKSQSYETQS
jgi:F1F0 ATPase subunit 2